MFGLESPSSNSVLVSSPSLVVAPDIIALMFESQRSQIHYWCTVGFLLSAEAERRTPRRASLQRVEVR